MYSYKLMYKAFGMIREHSPLTVTQTLLWVMTVPRRRAAVFSTVRPLELQMQLAFVRVGIGADGRWIDAHECGSQLAHRNTLPEAGSGCHEMNCRPWSMLPEKCGAEWTEAVALAVKHDFAIHGELPHIVSQAFVSFLQASIFWRYGTAVWNA